MNLPSIIKKRSASIGRIHRSRRGSSAVFLCVILSALVAICFAFIYSTMEYTTASRADAMMHLSGDSLLSEYDRDVLDEYGLFLLRENNKRLSSKLRGYMIYTFGREKSVRVGDVSASDSPYALTDPTMIQGQILDYMKADGLRLYRGKESGPAIGTHESGRSLGHGPTIASLPSRNMSPRSIADRARSLGEMVRDEHDLDDLLDETTTRGVLQSYVLGKFNSQTNTASKDHFFYHEAEYVLFGGLSDKHNGRLTYWALFALKEPFNLIQCPMDARRKAAIDLVSDCFPGHVRYIVKAGLIAAWASAESINDVELLMQGHKVPFRKKRDTWAISLKNVLDKMEEMGVDTSGKKYADDSEGAGSSGGSGSGTAGAAGGNTSAGAAGNSTENTEETSEEEEARKKEQVEKEVKKDFDKSNFKEFKLDYVIHPEKEEGLTYNQYLRILLSLEDTDVMTARILDLIQINMRKNVDGKFLICECCTGVNYYASVNGKEYRYAKHY